MPTLFRSKPPDSGPIEWHKQSSAFLLVYYIDSTVVAMGVLDRAKKMSGISNSDEQSYVCLACEKGFEVQHHSCPVCGSFDIRCSKWV
jgi:rRNA maturation endonuclease Nob1